MDSFHECLQEYGEGLEVVQICLEPEDSSIKDEELSALLDFSFEDKKVNEHVLYENSMNINGDDKIKSSKSDESLDQDDDMTITEDDVADAPRDLSQIRSKSADRKGFTENRRLSKQQSKDVSTSDEMVFAVTPTGLERVSFDQYWQKNKDSKETIIDCIKSNDNLIEGTPTDDTTSFFDATAKNSVQDDTSSLLFIDHEIDGYETCLDDDSSSVKCVDKNTRKINGDRNIKEPNKHDKNRQNNDNDSTAKNEDIANENVCAYTRPYVQEHIIKQMKSLKIEPLNINIAKKKKRSPTKPSKTERIKCVEYYNDQDECLREIRKRKLEEEERKHKEEQNKILAKNLATIERKIQLKKQEPSEESTDLESSDCHKCFLENYAYALRKAYKESKACKYCEVIREMLEAPKRIPDRRLSAPPSLNWDSPGSDTEEELLLLPETRDRRKSAGPLKFIVPSRRSSVAPPTMTVSVPERAHGSPAKRWGPPRRVTLHRGHGAPLGVSIVGGKVDIVSNREGDDGEEKAIFGIFIKNVVADSPAGNCGELHTGDRILEVDGVCVRSAQHERAVQLIKAAGDTVTLTVQSLLAWNTDSSDVEASSTPPPTPTHARRSPAPSATPKLSATPQPEIKITVTTEGDVDKEADFDQHEEKECSEEKSSKQVYSDSESSDEEDERDLGGRTYSEQGVEIDRASAGAIKRSKEEKEADPEKEDDFGYTTNKIRKKYAGTGDSVLAVKLERTSKVGLGISLAGHRDRSRMAVFVCGLHPMGAAARASPPVKVGDEILEVNGIVLHGRCHLNASVIIKGLVGPVFKIILLRRKSALEDVAVKPLTQFPPVLEEESSEDRFAAYKGVRDITVKKGPSGLGIMIIEGRHTEVGRGIFVSDLQEGSAAEQAGLQIGDLILAVNRDSLLSCSYDAAAAKLKQTEGVVVLTVCSPNQKDEEPSNSSANQTGSTSRPASRNQTPDPAPKGASRPTTPRPAPSPVKVEPPPDPATCPIPPNKDTVIEIVTNNDSLGMVLLGGSDTLITGSTAIVLDVYASGAVGRDGRLQPGDNLLECNHVHITSEMAHERRCLTIKQKTPKLKLVVHRPEPSRFQEVEVELTRKAGRALGLTVVNPVKAPGVYLGDPLSGSPAELDGRLQMGDFLVAIDGKDVSASDYLSIMAFLKLCGTKVVLKVKRFQCVR